MARRRFIHRQPWLTALLIHFVADARAISTALGPSIDRHAPDVALRGDAERTPRILCGRCKRPAGDACICASLPAAPIAVSTRVLVIQHPREARKAIASVPIIPLCVQQVDVVRAAVPWLRGHEEPLPRPADLDFFQRSIREGYEPLLLFPGREALALDSKDTIDRWSAQHGKVLLVLIDGTWSQAQNMMRHSPGLAAACTHVMFESDQQPIIGKLRREPQQHCMSTLEACARALRLVEPTAEAEAAAGYMERTLQAMVDGQLQHVMRSRAGWTQSKGARVTDPAASDLRLASSPRMRRPSGSSLRAPAAQMGVGGARDGKYASAAELEAAVRAYVAALPAGSIDDPSLPSPLNYKELQFNGRPDLVAGCMQYGGYLKVSNDLGLPVRIGVERAVGDAEGRGSSMRNVAGKKVVNAFNSFGKLDVTKDGLTEGERAVVDAAAAAAKKVADLRGKLLGLPDNGK